MNNIKKFKNHPSISTKKEEQTFKKFLTQLGKCNDTANDIPTKILKENLEVFAGCFHENIDVCIENSIFPSDLKVTNVTPTFKKKSKTSKDNYRLINIFPNISKIYERCLHNQIQTYFDEISSKYQCGFCNGLNAQHCLVSMIEKLKESVVDNGGGFGTLMADLPKAFDCYIMGY